MIIIPKKQPKKTIKLKSFSIGRGDAKASFRNVKRSKVGSLPYYSVDVYGKKGLRHKKLLIFSDDKKEPLRYLGLMYPYKIRKNLM